MIRQPIDRTRIESREVWVCSDCYMAHHYGTNDTTVVFADHWNREDYVHRAMSIDGELTDWTCPEHEGTDDDECQWCGEYGYEDGVTDFSKSPCDLCGSHYAGSRYRLGVEES